MRPPCRPVFEPVTLRELSLVAPLKLICVAGLAVLVPPVGYTSTVAAAAALPGRTSAATITAEMNGEYLIPILGKPKKKITNCTASGMFRMTSMYAVPADRNPHVWCLQRDVPFPES